VEWWCNAAGTKNSCRMKGHTPGWFRLPEA
jgi:hypothetical protein